ncbi:hypothetical protein L596_022894 [Steinernema carpocapsae]|uniref:Peptidase C1A papain C-terminal domain-containing protein n=1 Tax=Steinernema carpocapsae TaxID=34508 RepID=A0A4U5MBW1_STECR|nr:hypothetical protein L596_022894 [Steinernema carpocapsae]
MKLTLAALLLCFLSSSGTKLHKREAIRKFNTLFGYSTTAPLRDEPKKHLREEDIPLPYPEPTESDYFKGELPKHFDWRDHGALTPVQNQGDNCESCYAFSTTGNIESVYKVKKGVLLSLSKQQIVDCCRAECSVTQSRLNPNCCGGCKKGYTGFALEYVLHNGIETELDYRYHASTDDVCRFNRSEVAVRINGQVMLPQNDEDKVARYLIKHGAISASVHANKHLEEHYEKGIFDLTDEECPNDIRDLNHAILLVGFGEENGVKYWIVKNSWGTEWGEAGYFRMVRGKNLCGVAMYVTSAVIN